MKEKKPTTYKKGARVGGGRMLRASCQAAGASLCSELVTESGGRKNTTGEIERLVYMKKKITSRLLVSEVQISTDMEAMGWWGWGIMSLDCVSACILGGCVSP